MSIPVEVTLDALACELPVAVDYAAAAGLALDHTALSAEAPRFYVTFRNADGELFFAEFECHDYPMYPPTIEFVSEDRQNRGTKLLYPSCFHSTPCVCMRYNRKAYADLGGPHGDWRLIDWQLATPGGGAIDSIGMIVSDLNAKVSASRGRLG